ncbi:SDR family oxidoreductase [Candidatus Marimicrobium litorale]|uniref:Aldehyde reductase n=1 Tax=Candidatus Marimicrobium litorale TaxID=2518991 RepID=A0ABT3T281_9GAMM|nr:aldehyde reductase [Candidatus Marimicrobium litorale]MCX2975946.1 aldehyde reductase [Candidatus Marimicrobium litorale]
MEKVLVTGGSGFIGLHCIQQLLDRGFQVKTTIRSNDRQKEIVAAMTKHSSHPENLEFFVADLLQDAGWDEAVSGCRHVLHVASPFVIENPEDENVLIRPAVEGTLRVLAACRNSSVQKVVLTSSVAAIAYGHSKSKTLFDESDWSDTTGNISAYAKSKTLAEKAAWDFMEKLADNEKFELTTINPSAVTGPMLTDDIGTSNSFIVQLASGLMPVVPKIHMGFVDVRDVAKAHVFAMTSSKANGQRIIASEREMFFSDASKVLNSAGYMKAPTREIPDFVVRLMAPFIKQLGGLKASLGRIANLDKTKAHDIFDWKFISADESLTITARQLEEMGKLVKA